MAEFELQRDAMGRLVHVAGDGTRTEGVNPVRAFPLSSPEKGIALVSREGRELEWIASLDELKEANRRLLEEFLLQREFLPEIVRIEGIEGVSAPNLWRVETDRGATSFRLKSEDDIRRIEQSMVIVSSESGVNFLIRNITDLDRHSRRLLARFLS
ncbi:MAG: hypothetical protein B7X10_00275 [Burkholderiales bacterium 21-58-4]|nr:MAG: hypothetical protein B7X10_00275 [Burkholderiales bacterium 21-58-4]HQT24986.1 DUF1854 domain-containing protein [Burkholderiales bacterium]